MNIRQVLRPSLQQQVTAAERRPQKKSASALPQRTDHTSWSSQAMALINEQNRRVWEKKPEEKTGNSNLDALEKDLKKQDKCMKIFARLRSGDVVPPEDLRYLAKNDPGSYVLALAQRVEKPDPKVWESVLDDEDREELASSDSMDLSGLGGADASVGPVSAGGFSSGAGETV